MKKGLLFGFLVSALALSGLSAHAGFWEFTTPYKGPKNDIVTLVVITNYTQPRMMADLIQGSSRQPYLLFPRKEDGKIFFVPAKGNALEVRKIRVKRFVDFINPRRILVLGDRTYVPDIYLKLINDKHTIIKVYNKNWNKVAYEVGKILDLTNLADDFKELNEKYEDGNLYAPDKSVEASEITILDAGEPVEEIKELDIDVDEKPATGTNSTVDEDVVIEEPVVDQITDDTVIEEDTLPVEEGDGGAKAGEDPVLIEAK